MDVFIAATRFVRDKHREMGLDVPIVVLPYFTTRGPAAALDPGQAPEADSYLLFAGRLERVKGLHTLIPVFRGYEKARLLVAGTGRSEAAFRRMAAGAPNIVFLGHQSPSGSNARAVALIVPLLWYEVFGFVIIEAFAQGTPAIVRNIGGMPQIIEESGGGLVYETETELVAAMDRLLTESALRTALGVRGYQAFRQRWSAEAHIERYLALIAVADVDRTRCTTLVPDVPALQQRAGPGDGRQRRRRRHRDSDAGARLGCPGDRRSRAASARGEAPGRRRSRGGGTREPPSGTPSRIQPPLRAGPGPSPRGSRRPDWSREIRS